MDSVLGQIAHDYGIAGLIGALLIYLLFRRGGGMLNMVAARNRADSANSVADEEEAIARRDVVALMRRQIEDMRAVQAEMKVRLEQHEQMLQDEQRKRVHAEGMVRELTGRVQRLERQVRSMGAEPVQ